MIALIICATVLLLAGMFMAGVHAKDRMEHAEVMAGRRMEADAATHAQSMELMRAQREAGEPAGIRILALQARKADAETAGILAQADLEKTRERNRRY